MRQKLSYLFISITILVEYPRIEALWRKSALHRPKKGVFEIFKTESILPIQSANLSKDLL